MRKEEIKRCADEEKEGSVKMRKKEERKVLGRRKRMKCKDEKEGIEKDVKKKKKKKKKKV